MDTSLVRKPLYYGHLSNTNTSPYGHFSNTDTSPIRIVSYVPKKFSYIPLKITSIIRTTVAKSPPLGANSYKLNLRLLRTLRGPGVDNLLYVPFPVGGYTNVDTLSVSNTNTTTCQNVSFQNLHL